MRRGEREPFIYEFQLGPNPAELSDVGSPQFFFGTTAESGLSQDTEARNHPREQIRCPTSPSVTCPDSRSQDDCENHLQSTTPPRNTSSDTERRDTAHFPMS